MRSLSKTSTRNDSDVKSPSVPSHSNVSFQVGVSVLLTVADLCCLPHRVSTAYGSLLPFRSATLSPAALLSCT